MTVEVAFNFEDLNANLPDDLSTVDGAPILEDSEHMRVIKNVMKLVLKGTTGSGFSVPILATEDELNYCTGLLSNLQDQIDIAKLGSIPIDGLVMYSGLFSNIPSNFALADGAGGTPNLSNKFVYGTTTNGLIGTSGGSNDSVSVSHNHNADHPHGTIVSDSSGIHTHGVDIHNASSAAPNPFVGGIVGLDNATSQNTLFAGDHNHSVTIANALLTTGAPSSEIGSGKNVPPFYTLAWIQRIT